MESSRSLPTAFAELERFVDRWAISTEVERNRTRRNSSMEEIRDLYKAVEPRLSDIIAHLNEFPLDQMPDDAAQLLRLAMSTMEITPAVELYRQPDVVHAFDAERLEIVVDVPV